MTYTLNVWGPCSWLVKPLTEADHKRAMKDRAKMMGVDDVYTAEQAGNRAADGDEVAALAVRMIRRDMDHLGNKREQVRDMSDTRWLEDGTRQDVVQAIAQAQREKGRFYRSANQAAEDLVKDVNKILTERNFKTRSQSTVRKAIPANIIKK